MTALIMLLRPQGADACRRCDNFDFLCCDLPADDVFYLTSFSGEGMACGGQADGRWYYSTSWVRWSCGARLQVTNPDNGACVVVEVADAGPAAWVEEQAGTPILDTSPLVCRDLFASDSCGWSDHFAIVVVEVSEDTPLGPDGCPPPLPDYDCSFVAVDVPAELTSGQSAEVTIEMRNEGSAIWDADTLVGTTDPRDHESQLFDPSWTSRSRPTGPDEAVGPGQVGLFRFVVTAPPVHEAATIRESYGLVNGANRWFGPENAAVIDLIVNPPDGPGDGGGGHGGGGDDSDTDTDSEWDSDSDSQDDRDTDDGADPMVGAGHDGYAGGTPTCSTSSGRPTGLGTPWTLAFALCFLLVARCRSCDGR